MIHECPAHVSELRRESSRITYPGHYSPVEAGQLGVVVGNLFFDNPVEQSRHRRSGEATRRRTQSGTQSGTQGGTQWDTGWDTVRDTGLDTAHGARDAPHSQRASEPLSY